MNFIVIHLKNQITCQGIPPNTSNSMPSTHSPMSSFFTCPSQSLRVRWFSNDTAGCTMENGAAITKPSRMHSSWRASVHATEYNPPKTVYLKVHIAFLTLLVSHKLCTKDICFQSSKNHASYKSMDKRYSSKIFLRRFREKNGFRVVIKCVQVKLELYWKTTMYVFNFNSIVHTISKTLETALVYRGYRTWLLPLSLHGRQERGRANTDVRINACDDGERAS